MPIEVACSPSVSTYLRTFPGGIEISIPPTAVDQVFYRSSGGSLLISDDLRHFARTQGQTDARAIYSLLQYGALIPPLSVWKDVRRVVPGCTTTFRIGTETSIVEAASGYAHEAELPRQSPPMEEQIARVCSVIDGILQEAAEHHRLVILFSGGVDSGLLAARASALGLKDALLVNYAFGRDDKESDLAAAMATHLDLELQRIDDDSSNEDIANVLQNAAKYYRCPFGDHSTIPTSVLARNVIRRFGSNEIVVDGTGADGAFGLFAKADQWGKLHALPRSIRQLGATAYRFFGSATRKSQIEYRLRLFKRAADHPYPLSAVAQNPLDGIAYRVDKAIREEVDAMAMKWLASFCPPEPHVQLCAMDMALVCSQIFAQKSRSLFASSDLDIRYPFLSDEMLRVAIAAGSWDGWQNEAKWILKAALARHVPREMIYRPKQGFVAPIAKKLAHPQFLAAMEKAARGESPISSYLESEFFRKVLPKIQAGEPLPELTSYFLWTVAFTGAWLEQVDSIAPARANRGVI